MALLMSTHNICFCGEIRKGGGGGVLVLVLHKNVADTHQNYLIKMFLMSAQMYVFVIK